MSLRRGTYLFLGSTIVTLIGKTCLRSSHKQKLTQVSFELWKFQFCWAIKADHRLVEPFWFITDHTQFLMLKCTGLYWREFLPSLSFIFSSQSCWNCGRKASETCSGCNIARYCGSFCQHKDWERHHRICGQGLHSQVKPASLPTGRSAAATLKAVDGIPSPALEKTSATTSRSSTPASVTAVDTNGSKKEDSTLY